MTTYVLDTNVFIEAKRRYFGMDFALGFWEWLEREAAGEVVRSIKPVYDEMVDYRDELSDWVKGPGRPLFVEADEALLARVPDVTAWVNDRSAKQAKKSAFLAKADPFVVAAGLAHGWTVVTHEKGAGNSGDVKIPDACDDLGVAYIDTFELLRRRSVRLVLP